MKILQSHRQRLIRTMGALLFIEAIGASVIYFFSSYRHDMTNVSINYFAYYLNSHHSSENDITLLTAASTIAPFIEENIPIRCFRARPLPKRKFAVISASTPPNDTKRCFTINAECSYAFYLPLTALAWRRINFSTAVLISGDDKPWRQSGTHLNYVYRTLLDPAINATVIFLPSERNIQTGLAQVGRIFAADLEPFASEGPDTYLITSDADLFPLADRYSLPADGAYDILSTNAFASGKFKHRNKTNMDLLALSSIGMRVSTWKTVMNYRRLSNSSNPVQRIKDAMLVEFDVLPFNAKRGPFHEWYFDQEMVSYFIHVFNEKNNATCRTMFASGPVRWDRIGWPRNLTKEQWLGTGKTDCHTPLPGHTWSNFRYLQPLAQHIATETGTGFKVTSYWLNYVKLIDPANTTDLMATYPQTVEEAQKQIDAFQSQGAGTVWLHFPETHPEA